MAYFKNFSYLLYPDFKDSNQFQILKNITSRVVRKINPYDDKTIFYKYTMKDTETIESISLKLYGTQQYYWTILLANNLFDRNYDFPLGNKEFNAYIEEKYYSSSNAAQQYKYFIRPSKENFSTNEIDDLDNFIEVNYNVDTPALNKITVGSFEYEDFFQYPEYEDGIKMRYTEDLLQWERKQNEKKRVFYVVSKDYIKTFVEEFERLIR